MKGLLVAFLAALGLAACAKPEKPVRANPETPLPFGTFHPVQSRHPEPLDADFWRFHYEAGCLYVGSSDAKGPMLILPAESTAWDAHHNALIVGKTVFLSGDDGLFGGRLLGPGDMERLDMVRPIPTACNSRSIYLADRVGMHWNPEVPAWQPTDLPFALYAFRPKKELRTLIGFGGKLEFENGCLYLRSGPHPYHRYALVLPEGDAAWDPQHEALILGDHVFLSGDEMVTSPPIQAGGFADLEITRDFPAPCDAKFVIQVEPGNAHHPAVWMQPRSE
jgi:hypothetical protein